MKGNYFTFEASFVIMSEGSLHTELLKKTL